jgi:riboflavin kinase/FMN adenylyltransferase
MQVCRSIDTFPDAENPIVLAIGVFDGLHRGHQTLIDQARKSANDLKAKCWAMCFEPHPAQVLRPEAAPKLLQTRRQQLEAFEELGLDGTFLFPFDRTIAALSPQQFVEQLATKIPGLKGITVGSNWRFGQQATGDVGQLTALCEPFGIGVQAIEQVSCGKKRISSSRIRACILAGELDTANTLLGKPYAIEGTVVHGKKLGRTLGYPTANLAIENEIMPAPGVYAVRSGEWSGAGYTGRASEANVFEVHFFDRDEDLYGQTIELTLIARIRDDETFDSEDALRTQLAVDMEQAKTALT